ncbi:MAG: magnetosome biogenesis CDF transporter MamM [Magnetococcales bacterium]|nr:magnetosome biogenesis CDF transporter MamM [Magnetococcales bacterium]
MRYSKCVVCNEMVGWAGLLVNLVLSVLKLFIGVLSGSHALVAGSLYSGKDVVTSVLIIVGLKVSKKPLDEKHPFGHGKVEFLFSLAVGMVMILTTAWLLFNVATVLLEGDHRPPHLIALWVAVLSILVNLFFLGYSRCVAFEINSPIVRTLSKHHHSDIVSSGAIAFGIIGSHYLGLPWLDSLVAVGEAVDLLKLGGEVFWDAYQGLMDIAGPKNVEDDIRRRANSIKGVVLVQTLRSRRVGQELYVSMVIGVDPEMEIGQAKQVAKRVEEEITESIPHLGDINVHFSSPPGSVPEFREIKKEMDHLATLVKTGVIQDLPAEP